MKIALAQIQSEPGNIPVNISKHLKFIKEAAKKGAGLIVFPELSLTNYEPGLATELAFSKNDDRLNIFKEYSNKHSIFIAVGVPLRIAKDLYIGMVIFKPDDQIQYYYKQFLHEDELSFFTPKISIPILEIQQLKICLAICYELSVEEHAENIKEYNADIYLAGVAKDKKGMSRACDRLRAIASAFKIPVMIVNCLGKTDAMKSTGIGKSAYFDENGDLKASLEQEETLLIINHD